MFGEKPSSEKIVAIVLGASWFPKAPKLAKGTSFYNSAADFRDYLIAADGLNLCPENVAWLFDESSPPSEQLDQIVDFLQRRVRGASSSLPPPEDLILYY